MDQAVVFTIFFAALLTTWLGRRKLSLVLWIVALAALAGDYLFHATDKLPLSF